MFLHVLCDVHFVLNAVLAKSDRLSEFASYYVLILSLLHFWFNSPTATIFGDVHSLLTQWTGQQSSSASSFPAPPLPQVALEAIKNLDVNSAVIVGHSAGGRAALDMVTGRCC